MKKYSPLLWKMDNVQTEQSIIGTRRTGEWVRISKELKQYLDNFLELKTRQAAYIEQIDSMERSALIKLINTMELHGFVVDTDNAVSEGFVFTFETTRKCNLACRHCSMNAVGLRENLSELSTQQMKRCLNTMQKLGGTNVVLTGGEPMTRNDFFELVRYIHFETDMNIRLMTNATLINSDNVQFLKQYIQSIDISIDGVDEKSCSLIRGKNVFRKVINAIQLLNEIDYNTKSLSMVETGTTAQYVERFYELSKELNCRPMIRKIEFVGRAKQNRDILNVGQSYAVETETEEPDTFIRDLRGICCGAFDRELYVNSVGDIYPCALFETCPEYRIGNIFDSDIYEKIAGIHQSDMYDAFWNFLERMPEKCRNCSVRFFCHTCPHISDVTSKNRKAFDEICLGRRHIFEEMVWNR